MVTGQVLACLESRVSICGRHQKGSSPRRGKANGGSYSNFSLIEYSLK
jgi:hypothetical protein